MPGRGGETTRPMASWPTTFEQRQMEASLTSCDLGKVQGRSRAGPGELDELRPHAVVPVAIEGEEAAAQPALAIEALRGGVHRDELRPRSQLRLRLPQQRERAPEGVEVVPPLAGARGSAVVDVRLVDLGLGLGLGLGCGLGSGLGLVVW